jgi:hypothetical protein
MTTAADRPRSARAPGRSLGHRLSRRRTIGISTIVGREIPNDPSEIVVGELKYDGTARGLLAAWRELRQRARAARDDDEAPRIL